MLELRTIVCGGRNYTDYDQVKLVLDRLLEPAKAAGIELTIIHGGAVGADTMAETWAKENNVRTICFPADWSHYGPAAGSIRNKQMLDEGKPHLVIHFPGGRGTRNMVSIARKSQVQIVSGSVEEFNQNSKTISISL